MQKTIGLFATCFVDIFRPSLIKSSILLLQKCGFRVVVGGGDSCCGRTALEAGDSKIAQALAEGLLYDFLECDYIVTPSSACATMAQKHYGSLFPHPKELGHNIQHNMYHFDKHEDLPHRADVFRCKFYEITDFLYRIAQFQPDDLSPQLKDKKIIYHESCGARFGGETHLSARGLLSQIGVPVFLPEDSESCCGFGGYFSTDFPDLAAAITDKKCHHLLSSNPDLLISTDLDCLLHLVGRLSRLQKSIPAYHLVEFLSGGFLDSPPLGQ